MACQPGNTLNYIEAFTADIVFAGVLPADGSAIEFVHSVQDSCKTVI